MVFSEFRVLQCMQISDWPRVGKRQSNVNWYLSSIQRENVCVYVQFCKMKNAEWRFGFTKYPRIILALQENLGASAHVLAKTWFTWYLLWQAKTWDQLVISSTNPVHYRPNCRNRIVGLYSFTKGKWQSRIHQSVRPYGKWCQRTKYYCHWEHQKVLESRDGAVVIVLASNPRPGVINGLSWMLVLVLAPRVFLRVLWFSSLHKKSTFLNSNSIGNSRAMGLSFKWPLRATLIKTKSTYFYLSTSEVIPVRMNSQCTT